MYGIIEGTSKENVQEIILKSEKFVHKIRTFVHKIRTMEDKNEQNE